MTLAFFKDEMARMNGLRFVPSSLDTHWEGLSELPDDVLHRAVGRAVRTRDEFPTPRQLREDADAVGAPIRPEEDRSVPLPEPVDLGALPTGYRIRATHDWTYTCDDCNDSGVRSFWCGREPSERYPWMSVAECALPNCRKTKYAHEWATACHCAEYNPVVKARKERNAHYAETRMKGGSA